MSKSVSRKKSKTSRKSKKSASKKYHNSLKIGYSRVCDMTQNRQPIKVTKSQCSKAKKMKKMKSVKIGKDYYICPDIYDIDAKEVISVDEFVKNNHKSPYGAKNKLYFTGVQTGIVKSFNNNPSKENIKKLMDAINKKLVPMKISKTKLHYAKNKSLKDKVCCYYK